MKWKIFYGNSTFSSEDGDPTVAPARDVQVIVQDHPEVGVELVTASDYYVWEGRWRGVDIFGLFDYLIEPGWKRVLCGRTITRQEYSAVYHQADTDKNGWLPREVRADG